MKKIAILLSVILFCIIEGHAQTMTPQQYILEYKDLAIREMKRMGVPAAITLAQGLLESQNGNSDLVRESNNHFGIKCKSTWNAETVEHDDDAPDECFRKYKDAEDSYRDHSNFLRGNSRYDFLFKLDPADYKDWAFGLSKAGYATNPKYPEILIKSIEKYDLEQYTMDAINEVPHFDASKFTDDPDDKYVMSDSDIEQEMNLTINGLKALYEPKGTSLLAVATRNSIDLSKLLSINELSNDSILDKGQYIFLEKKKKEGKKDYCVSESGETLYDIAQKYGVLLQSLCAYNNFNSDDYLVAGTKIFLKPHFDESGTVSEGANDSQSNKSEKISSHKVCEGESLYAISKKFKVSVKQLKEWNHLSTDNLQIGQALIVSK